MENSGIKSILYEFIKAVGKVITGITIPLIIPYLEREDLQESPGFSSCVGIINCFKVESPERIYDVKATGKAIFTILILCCQFAALKPDSARKQKKCSH